MNSVNGLNQSPDFLIMINQMICPEMRLNKAQGYLGGRQWKTSTLLIGKNSKHIKPQTINKPGLGLKHTELNHINDKSQHHATAPEMLIEKDNYLSAEPLIPTGDCEER